MSLRVPLLGLPPSVGVARLLYHVLGGVPAYAPARERCTGAVLQPPPYKMVQGQTLLFREGSSGTPWGGLNCRKNLFLVNPT